MIDDWLLTGDTAEKDEDGYFWFKGRADDKENIPSDSRLKSEIEEFVKERSSAHQYPREIEFVRKLPMTATGKIKRGDLKNMEIKRRNQ